MTNCCTLSLVTGDGPVLQYRHGPLHNSAVTISFEQQLLLTRYCSHAIVTSSIKIKMQNKKPRKYVDFSMWVFSRTHVPYMIMILIQYVEQEYTSFEYLSLQALQL